MCWIFELKNTSVSYHSVLQYTELQSQGRGIGDGAPWTKEGVDSLSLETRNERPKLATPTLTKATLNTSLPSVLLFKSTPALPKGTFNTSLPSVLFFKSLFGVPHAFVGGMGKVYEADINGRPVVLVSVPALRLTRGIRLTPAHLLPGGLPSSRAWPLMNVGRMRHCDGWQAGVFG
ncbi:hypothetical protein E2C01_011791 [Portunus trituberculatus]|uniref:Uncharacterized protein n=1 Tax=Portunus trituberculatus TaxID=210409 RepID=A0A5B7DC26_PORTR|nr:hypothetical protein [Portunus trituberculatus]